MPIRPSKCPGRVSQLYTNQVIPYFRAPHIYVGFPTRYIDRGWSYSATQLPRYGYRKLRGAKSRREGTAVTDGMFMASRDATTFHVWPESFIRPGLRGEQSWFYGDTYQNHGLVETKSMFEDGATICRSTSVRILTRIILVSSAATHCESTDSCR
ncbi:MAG: hypothetical protein CM1200mP2_41240 [Planctomycetaceae bacterium]|nr:MAG: hypothetical protein CM1200mP2_41240 [Planctomycetaceae bacterium]